MTTIDDLDWGPEPPERIETATPKRCLHAKVERIRTFEDGQVVDEHRQCTRCGKVIDEEAARRGRNNKKRGGAHELKVARRYGGEKVGPLGLPEDIRGSRWLTQVKTMKGSPPTRWTTIFAAMEASRGSKTPRLLLRYLRGPGQRPIDFFVVMGEDWLAELGKDEGAA